MEYHKLKVVKQSIRDAAPQAAAPGVLSAMVIDWSLRTGEETWEGAGSGRFSLAQSREDEAYTGATKSALRDLFDLLVDLLPGEVRSSPPIAAETIPATN